MLKTAESIASTNQLQSSTSPILLFIVCPGMVANLLQKAFQHRSLGGSTFISELKRLI
jgi:hypothetical protein